MFSFRHFIEDKRADGLNSSRFQFVRIFSQNIETLFTDTGSGYIGICIPFLYGSFIRQIIVEFFSNVLVRSWTMKMQSQGKHSYAFIIIGVFVLTAIEQAVDYGLLAAFLKSKNFNYNSFLSIRNESSSRCRRIVYLKKYRLEDFFSILIYLKTHAIHKKSKIIILLFLIHMYQLIIQLYYIYFLNISSISNLMCKYTNKINRFK